MQGVTNPVSFPSFYCL